MWSYKELKPKLQVILAFRLACQLGLTRAGFLPSKCERGAGESRMFPKGSDDPHGPQNQHWDGGAWQEYVRRTGF